MLSLFPPGFVKLVNSQSRCSIPSLTLGLVLCCVGCAPAKTLKPELTLQVQPMSQSGRYAVSGQTTLPNQSRITVQAVRPLKPLPTARLTNQQPLYAILDRQQVEVTDGKWQANLNLWGETTGPAQELWQIKNSQLGLALRPETDVTFLAVSDALNGPLDIKTNKDTNQPLENAVLQFSRDGSAYLQAKQITTISPPVSQTALKIIAPTAVQLKATAISSQQSEQKRQNDAPLLPLEYLR